MQLQLTKAFVSLERAQPVYKQIRVGVRENLIGDRVRRSEEARRTPILDLAGPATESSWLEGREQEQASEQSFAFPTRSHGRRKNEKSTKNHLD